MLVSYTYSEKLALTLRILRIIQEDFTKFASEHDIL